MAKNNCDNCFYYSQMRSGTLRHCTYIFKTGRMRPCPPGDGCTEKIPMKVNRRKRHESKICE